MQLEAKSWTWGFKALASALGFGDCSLSCAQASAGCMRFQHWGIEVEPLISSSNRMTHCGQASSIALFRRGMLWVRPSGSIQ